MLKISSFKPILGLALLFLSFSAYAQQRPAPTSYRYDVDLNNIKNDAVNVTLNVASQFAKDGLTFHLPKIVPGTYSIYDFGRFVSNLKAFDASNAELEVKHDDTNAWVIPQGSRCTKITYEVEDTWDSDKDNVVFEPGGTNIEDKKNVVINNFGFFGYFEGQEKFPYYVNVAKPEKFYGSTALERIGGSATSDTYYAQDYHFLADGPIMYCEPDTMRLNVGGAKVLISVYSPNKKVSAANLAVQISKTLDAQRKYLGGTLPVDHYAFLIYLSKNGYNSGSYGALEHSYCSFYCFIEDEPSAIAQTVCDISAHEFFHVLTPLSIHSEEIQYFDFTNPKMSEHLWMYEGATEYASHLAQLKGGLTSLDHFAEVMGEKMRSSKSAFNDDLSFTEMSKNVLDTYKDQYGNVYQKGALICWCLDLKLRNLSGGTYGIQNMLHDLAKLYGKDKAFKDSELFDQIAKTTGFPEIRQFFKDYVEGSKPLPIAELLPTIGFKYEAKGIVEEVSPFGGLENPGVIGFDMAMLKLKIEDADKLDEFGKNHIGFKTGDIIVQWNGEDLGMTTINTIFGNFQKTAKAGQTLTISVLRGGKAVELKTKIVKVKMEKEHIITVGKAKRKAKKMRKAFLTNPTY